MKNTDKILVDRARGMRKEPTEEENKMWYLVLQGLKPRFLRQRVIGNYIVDFCSCTLKLIIEIDGVQHNFDENQEYEKRRTAYLEKAGYRILRFTNSDINKDIKVVSRTVFAVCEERVKELGLGIRVYYKNTDYKEYAKDEKVGSEQ